MIVPNGWIARPSPLLADGAALNRQGFAGAGSFLPEAGGHEGEALLPAAVAAPIGHRPLEARAGRGLWAEDAIRRPVSVFIRSRKKKSFSEQ